MIAMTNTKGLTYAAIMLKVKDLQELITTYNAIMAGQLNIDEDLIWNKIMATLKPELAETVCPNSSTFVNTRDGLECNIRNAKGDMLGNCYSENNRMNGRRWTIKWHNP